MLSHDSRTLSRSDALPFYAVPLGFGSRSLRLVVSSEQLPRARSETECTVRRMTMSACAGLRLSPGSLTTCVLMYLLEECRVRAS